MPRFHRVRRTSEVNLERSEMGKVEKSWQLFCERGSQKAQKRVL